MKKQPPPPRHSLQDLFLFFFVGLCYESSESIYLIGLRDEDISTLSSIDLAHQRSDGVARCPACPGVDEAAKEGDVHI